MFGGEAARLRAELAEVAAGRAFLLQAGDCAETFADLSDARGDNRLRVLLQMGIVLTYGSGRHIVKVARMAGQFAKPRSSSTERVDGVELPVYRGDIVNDVEPVPAARVPDPRRMLTAYHHASAKLNLIRSLTTGGFGGLSQIHAWNRDFVAASPVGRRYERIAVEIDRALRFVQASRIAGPSDHADRVDVWTSHEALLLPYEEALTRRDEQTGDWYDTSAHMLWVGERTRTPDGAHVEFLSGVENPVACKLGPTATPKEALELCERLNPERVPGRLTLISRMGATRVGAVLPLLLAAVRDAGHPVVWACDPMHANTIVTSTGRKTRHFDDVLEEVRAFFAACKRRVGVPRRPSRRTHRRRRHGVPWRRREPQRAGPRPPLRDHVRPPPQRPPVARSRLPRRRVAAHHEVTPHIVATARLWRAAARRGLPGVRREAAYV